MKLQIISFILITSTAVRSSLAIYCYSCNSLFDPACGDIFNNETLDYVNCDYELVPENLGSATICRKLTQTIYHNTRIIRSCGYIQQPDLNKKNKCYKQAFTDATETIYCECETDYCNISGRLKGSAGLLAALGSMLGLKHKLWNY